MQRNSAYQVIPNNTAVTLASGVPVVITGVGSVGTNNVISLYDNVAHSGNPILTVDFSSIGYYAQPFQAGIVFKSGCTVSVSLGADAVVFFYVA